ncbi:MAG TPA: c-type cytochrome [Gemmatimonadales bacterium]|nr:c-type cytochrome [Gemmatimonadales bacterium]
MRRLSGALAFITLALTFAALGFATPLAAQNSRGLTAPPSSAPTADSTGFGDTTAAVVGQKGHTIEAGQATTLPQLPAGVTLDLVREGDSVFHGAGHCFACHGANAQGLPDAGSALTAGLNFVPIQPRAIDSLVSVGIPEALTRSGIRMPPRGGKSDLSDDQIRAVAAYVWAISTVNGEPWPGGHASHDNMIPPGSTAGTSTARPAVAAMRKP